MIPVPRILPVIQVGSREFDAKRAVQAFMPQEGAIGDCYGCAVT